MDTIRYWSKGIRLYIALLSALVTVLTIFWAHSAYAGTTLYATRVEEVFAWLATILIPLAIAIGPVCKVFTRLPGKSMLFDARRLLGVSAAWFATLHVSIAYFSLFKHANPFSLPSLYQRSFLAGIVALIILLAMALTSFDAAFQSLGKWWFRLHRLIYPAILLVLLHAFLTGVHATQPAILIAIAVIGAAFVALYLAIITRSPKTSVLQLATVLTMTLLLSGVLIYGVSQHTAQTRMVSYGVTH